MTGKEKEGTVSDGRREDEERPIRHILVGKIASMGD